MVTSTENPSEEEEIFSNTFKSQQQKQNNQKRIGIIGFGRLGQFLKIELSKSPEFLLQKIWNRTEDSNEGVLPLSELNEENLKDIDLIIEVSHPDIIHNYANTILKHADLFIGSVTALAVEKTYNEIKAATRRQEDNHSVFIPSGALWGSRDIQKMADFGVLKTLSITTMLHPNALQLAELSNDSSSELKVLHSFCEECKKTNSPKVLYDGTVRQLCLMAPNNVNSMASAGIAAHTLGLDHTRAKLIVDPELRNWQIIEYEATGENGFRTLLRRENPSQPSIGETTGETTYFSFLSSVKETLQLPRGLNIC